MKKVTLVSFLALFLSLTPTFAPPLAQGYYPEARDFEAPLTQIAWGSCQRQSHSMDHWNQIGLLRPDLWIWAGDNIYADLLGPNLRWQEYLRVFDSPQYLAFRSLTPIIGTWDDHDYCSNNMGSGCTDKDENQELALNFLEEPRGTIRRAQQGIYDSKVFGPLGKQTQVILLDMRYFKPHNGSNELVLGKRQWSWLQEQVMESQAQVIFIVSSIQVFSDHAGKENWSHFESSRKLLFDLLAKAPSLVYILSGDVHYSEVMRRSVSDTRKIYEFTASGMTHVSPNSLPENEYRLGRGTREKNFGWITIDWQTEGNPKVQFQTRSTETAESIEMIEAIEGSY